MNHLKIPLRAGESEINTSYHRIDIITNVYTLTQVLGKPDYSENDGDEINYEWRRKTQDGKIFTVYDKDEDGPIFPTTHVSFHIGAEEELTAIKAKLEILNAMINLPKE